MRTFDLVTGLTVLVGVIIVATLAQMAWGSFQLPLLGNEDFSQNGFLIYPNPTSEILHLKTNSHIENLEIYSMLGQKIISQTNNSVTAEVDLYFTNGQLHY